MENKRYRLGWYIHDSIPRDNPSHFCPFTSKAFFYERLLHFSKVSQAIFSVRFSHKFRSRTFSGQGVRFELTRVSYLIRSGFTHSNILHLIRSQNYIRLLGSFPVNRVTDQPDHELASYHKALPPAQFASK